MGSGEREGLLAAAAGPPGAAAPLLLSLLARCCASSSLGRWPAWGCAWVFEHGEGGKRGGVEEG